MRKILVDMDGILADLLGGWLGVYNAMTGKNVVAEDVTAWDFKGSIPPEHMDMMWDILRIPGVFRTLSVLPGAQEAVRELQTLGDVFILTSATASTFSIKEKMEWLEEHFPNIDRKNVFTGHHKEMVNGDILIDDGPPNIKKYRKAWPEALIYGIQWPYNMECYRGYGAYLVPSYKDTKAAWEEIVKDIKLL